MSILSPSSCGQTPLAARPLGVGARSDEEGERMMEPLGLSPTEEAVYRALLGGPDSSASQIADRTGLPAPRVRDGLSHLVALRLAQRSGSRPARFRPAQPDIAITALLNERQAALDRARLAVPELLAEYHSAT